MDVCLFVAAMIDWRKHNGNVNTAITKLNPSPQCGAVVFATFNSHLSEFKLLPLPPRSVPSSLTSHNRVSWGSRILSLSLWMFSETVQEGYSEFSAHLHSSPNILFAQCSPEYASCPSGTAHCRLLLFRHLSLEGFSDNTVSEHICSLIHHGCDSVCSHLRSPYSMSSKVQHTSRFYFSVN